MPLRGKVVKKIVRRQGTKIVTRRRRRPIKVAVRDKVGEFEVLDEVGDVDPITGDDVPASNKASEDKKVTEKKVEKKNETDKKETKDSTKTDKGAVVKKEPTAVVEKSTKPVKKRTKTEELIYDVLRFSELLERLREYRVYIKRKGKDGLVCPIGDVKEISNSLFNQCVMYSGVKKYTGELHFCFKRDTHMSESMKNLENYTTEIRNVLKAFQELVKSSGKPLYNPTTSEGFWRAVVARSNHCGDLMFQVEVNAATKAESETTYKEVKELLTEFFTNGLGKDCRVTTLYVKIVFNKLLSVSHCAMGEGYLEEKVLDLKFKIYPRTYFWICGDAATVIGNQLKAIMGEGKYTDVLEIGCGTGVLGQLLAKSCNHVYGVDTAVATKEADDNAKFNGLDNCSYSGGTYKASLLNVIPKILGPHSVFAMVNDPGLNLLSQALMETLRTVKSVKKLVYITQFSKKCMANLFTLCQVPGIGYPYFPENIIPIDLGLDRYRAIVVLKHCATKIPPELKNVPSPVKLPAVKKEAVTVTKPSAVIKPITVKPPVKRQVIKRDREGRLIRQKIAGSVLTGKQRLAQLRAKAQSQKNDVLKARQRVNLPEKNTYADSRRRKITRDKFGRKIVSGREDKFTVTRDRLGRRIIRGRDNMLGQRLQKIPTNRFERQALLREKRNAIINRTIDNVDRSHWLGKQNDRSFMHETPQLRGFMDPRLRRGMGIGFERERQRQTLYEDSGERMRQSYQQRFPPDIPGSHGSKRNIWMSEDGLITVEGHGSPGTNFHHESRHESRYFNLQEHDLRERLRRTSSRDVADHHHRIDDRGMKSQDLPDLREYLQSNRSNTDNYTERDLRILLAENRLNLQSDFDMTRREIPRGREMRERSPRSKGIRDLSPRNRRIREPSPRSRGRREPSPQSRGRRDPSPRSRGIREPSPRSRKMRPPSPYNRGIREPSPRGRGIREPSPRSRAIREPSPRSRAIREPSPRSRAIREPSPRNRGIREPSPRNRGMVELSSQRGRIMEPGSQGRGIREISPRSREMRELSPRSGRIRETGIRSKGTGRLSPRRERPHSTDLTQSSRLDDKYRSDTDYMSHSKIREPENLQKSYDLQHEERRLREITMKDRGYRSPERESRINSGMSASDRYRERERVLYEPNEKMNREYEMMKSESNYRDNFDKNVVTRGGEREMPRDDWNRTVNLVRKDYSRSPGKDIRTKYDTDYKERGPRDDPRKDVRQDYLGDVRSKEIFRDLANREQRHMEGRHIDDIRRDKHDDRRDESHIRRERDDIRRDRDDVRRDGNDFRKERDDGRRDRVENRRDRDDHRKVGGDRRGRESIEDTLVETLKQVVPNKGFYPDAAYKLKEVLVSAIHKVGLENDTSSRRSSVPHHAERSRYESDPPRIAPEPPRITLDPSPRIAPEPPRITSDHPRSAYPHEPEIIRPYGSRVESGSRGLPTFSDDRHYNVGDVRYRSVRSPPKPVPPPITTHDYGMGNRDLSYNRNIIPIPDTAGRISIPPPTTARYFPPPAATEASKPYIGGTPAPNNFYSRSYEPQLNLPPPQYRGAGSNVLRPPGTEISPWISKMPPM